MARPLRIPGLIDLLRVRSAAEIRMLADDPRLDRRFEATGPWLNRVVAGRLRAFFTEGGKRLPGVAARDDAVRKAAATSVERAFAAAPTTAEIAPLVAYLRGEQPSLAVGAAVQQILAERFRPEAHADADTWRAAERLDAAPRANPLRLLLWWFWGEPDRSRTRLASLVDGDGAGIHAIGVAVHNLVEGLNRMRALVRDPALVRSLSTEAAVARSLPAPPRVLRQATAAGTTAAGSFEPGTLVVMELEAARGAAPGPAVTFMAGTWSACPAGAWVEALFHQLWREATAER